jgi:hypothetical protein
MDAYPPEFDGPEICLVCGRDVSARETECDCPECPECAEVGSPDCYRHGHLKPLPDSVESFCQHIGIEPIADALRAIDRHNTEHVWLVLHDGRRVRYEDRAALLALEPCTRLRAVGVGGIAWDGSDWEYSEEIPAGAGWAELDAARARFDGALAEHLAEGEEG